MCTMNLNASIMLCNIFFVLVSNFLDFSSKHASVTTITLSLILIKKALTSFFWEVHFCELGHHLFNICQVIGAPDWLLQQCISMKIVSGFLFECQECRVQDGGNRWRCDGQ